MARLQGRQQIAALAVALCAIAALALTPTIQPQAAVATREEAYRANNIGVSKLEQFDFDAATASFRRALTIDPKLSIARLNLGIALFYGGNPDAAQTEVTAVRSNLADRPQPDYVLGLIARGAGRSTEAIDAFLRVQKMDADDVGTAINLGQLYRQERKFPEAVAEFRKALAGQPFNATAMYGLANTLVLAGNADEGKAAMERFQKLSESGYAVTYSQTYLDQGRYAEAIVSTGAEAPLVDPKTPGIRFTDATAMLASAIQPGSDRGPGMVTTVDLDGDGDLDLLDASRAGLRILQNDGRSLADVSTALLGELRSAPATGAIAGDYDNDARADLIVLRPSGLSLLHREGATFSDATAASGLTPVGSARSAAWLDADHDGDLDLFVAGGTEGSPDTRLFQNNGKGQFADMTSVAGLTSRTLVNAVVPTDFDNRRDIDVLLLSPAAAPALFRNRRDGSFQDVASEVGLGADRGAALAAIGDINKDNYADFFFAHPRGAGVLALSNGRGQFATSFGPPAAANARAAQFVDYDNDGLLDLFLLTAAGPRLLRSIGRDWTDVTAQAIPAAMTTALSNATSLAAGDMNGDGRVDIAADGPTGLTLWQNSGASRATSLKVNLAARVSNRSAIGARVEMRAGSLRQQHELYSAVPAPAPGDVIFGLGDRAGADVVRVLWPSGILQAETAAVKEGALPGVITNALKIEELDRKPSSCPYLYTWNGSRFDFITDFLGGGEMGYWVAPGLRNTPDPDEYVRIDGSRLQPREGKYELRITNELEESLFLDRAELVVVSHPVGVDVHPNEGLRPDPGPFRIYSAQSPQPPVAAADDQGRNVFDQIRTIDRRYVDSFGLERVRGYARDHALVLTLPKPGPSGRRLLLLNGWTDYAFSGDNVAAHQAGLVLSPPALEFKTSDGQWRTAIEDIGMPVGRPQTVAVDIAGHVPDAATEVRIKTTMRIYWDQVLVDTSDGRASRTVERLDPITANLRWRGFSAEATPDGREPYGYDYSRVSTESPWKLLPGRYTREGDVRALLLRTDDMFVISRPGDEIALSFDAVALPPLPAGWTRTFFLYADGFSKEMNLNSASPDELLPLPFHGMTRYPYTSPETYPTTPAHREYQERYNTRIVPRTVPSIDRALERDSRSPR